MIAIPEVSDLEIAFPADVMKFMPAMKDIPEEYPNAEKWDKLFSTWFYFGIKNATFTPKAGVDQVKALRAIKAIMGSFQPKHEHKTAAVAYLMSEWFDDVKYEAAKKPEDLFK